ncbi:hypothetical protein [uncultured Thiohalocapsa sp.]|uniref:hypothetical protein n=1 Tax=uncultured Thiohalocapsa sp. TaxID=768990 RepID=UPI0025E71DB9|nr:hypothetical protein [uncultured Thiohalocapsa sp.]
MARQRFDEQATPVVPDATDRSHMRLQSQARTGVWGASMVLSAIMVGGGLGLAAAATLQPAAGVEPDLANLLHAMVGIKALIFAGAAALVLLRLRGPVRAASIAGYAAGLGMSAAALFWLWGLSGLFLGSALFYGGLILTYLTASRDPLLVAGLKRSLPQDASLSGRP